jgi:hypothetical protein
MKNQIRLLSVMLLIASTVAFFSCKKDEHVPPNISLKTDAGYTSADATVAQGDSVLFGIVAEKTEDELLTFDVSVAYDGSASTNSILNEDVFSTGADGFERDVKVGTRLQAGTEKYTFTVTDRDGNIAQKSVTLTVQ